MMLPVKGFTHFITQNNLFFTADKVLAAVSGGMDSVLMVHLLKASGYDFGIAHCNFQLRGDESTRDEAFCRQLADEMGVAFHVIKFDTANYANQHKISIQMAARALRYDWFEQIMQAFNYSVIALAHHQNDAIETILLNLTRGTGIAGLHGILPKNGSLVRPLLFLSRDEINEAIISEELKYVEDSSNSSVKYARNLLRHNVIPELKKLNPDLERTFESNLQRFREMEQLLEIKLRLLRAELMLVTGNEIHLPIAGIKKLEPQRLLLFSLLKDYGFNEATVDDIIAALDKHPGRQFETRGYRLILDRDRLMLSKKESNTLTPVMIGADEHAVHYGYYKLSVLHDDSPLIIKDNPMATSVSADQLIYPLTLRGWQQSDYFYPLGMKTKKKLSDFFINQKIPLHVKNAVPLLFNGDGRLIWIGGYRLDDRFKVTKNTKKVTIFELYRST